MNVLVCDDNLINLEIAETNIKIALPMANIFTFQDSLKAKEELDNTSFDLVFLDIEMPNINGIELAQIAKEKNKNIKIIFYTSHLEYAYDAFKVRANGYLLKGASAQEIKDEIEYLFKKEENKLIVTCFGKFDCFYNNEIVKFERSKAKELFALLVVHQGKACTLNDIEAALFEGETFSESHLKQIHVFYSSLVKSLSKIGMESVIVKSRNNYSIDVTKIQCDYYDYLSGKLKEINGYNADFLPDYEWALL